MNGEGSASEGGKSVVTVDVAGGEYTVRSAASPEYARECAAYVNRVISEIVGQGRLIEGHKAAILAALSLTDELFQARSEVDALRRRIDRLASDLAGQIDAAVPSDDLASNP